MLRKIVFNTRDQLTTIDPSLVAAVQADGNYSHVFYINKREISLTTSISKVEEILKANAGRQNRFIRLNRSIIVNHSFLHKIDLQRELLILTDGSKGELRLNLSKKTLKSYKEAVIQSIKIKNSHEKNNIG